MEAKFYRVADVAQRLNCSVSTVYALVESGRLGHYRCPGVRVSENQLKSYLQKTKQERDPMLEKPLKSRSPLRHIRL